MQLCHCLVRRIRMHLSLQKRLAVKQVAIFMTVALLLANQNALSQTVTYSAKDVKLESVFSVITKQTGYGVICDYLLIKGAKALTINVDKMPLQQFMSLILQGLPLEYKIDNKTIVIQKKTLSAETGKVGGMVITGIVTDLENHPLEGAAIQIKGTNYGTSTNILGKFELTGVAPNATLVIFFTGYTKKEIQLNGNSQIIIRLEPAVKALDETVIIGYGKTTRRLNTGSVAKVSSDEITKQPVTNFMEALKAKVPGMFVQSNSGLAGSNLTVQIRGVGSIAAGNNPLYVINGVPFTSTSLDLVGQSYTTAAPTGLSPLNSINPDDIESIEVLKDADATAIYGSRGANGVILVSTKKGRPGNTTLSIKVLAGMAKTPRHIDFLDTKEYLKMRRQAFINDGIIPTVTNAPDLLVWDTSKTTDWQKELIGGTASIRESQLSLSGGDSKTQFVFGGSCRHTGTVFPGADADNRITGYLNLNHSSEDKKLELMVSANYSIDDNKYTKDYTAYVNLPPNYPIYDSLQKVIWRPGTAEEPYASLYEKTSNKTKSFLANTSCRYEAIKGLYLKISLGYTQIDVEQLQIRPSQSLNPGMSGSPGSSFGDNHVSTWIAEPQIAYNKKFNSNRLSVLIGSTFQRDISQGKLINASNYSSDAFLDNVALAGTITFQKNLYTRYSYNSLFARVNYNFSDRYLFNATFRRDGSSRFGPGKQFGNFGALGTAWIFSSEEFIKKGMSFISYGKIRMSYGITGNDQITDYQFMSTYQASPYTYGVPAIRPARIANDKYGWETNKKAEIGLELGFIADRILFELSYYNNLSGNQLVDYPTAGQTGFSSYQANLPAVLSNSGFELSLRTTNIKSESLKWTTGFNITIPRTKLLAFPGISSTSYGTANLVIGQPLKLEWGYQFLSIDPSTGLVNVTDIDKNGAYTYPGDYISLGTTLPRYYGGLTNAITCRNWQLDFTFQFTKRNANRIVPFIMSGMGTPYNVIPDLWYDSWQKIGDRALFPKASTTTNVINRLYLSDAVFGDASYLKLQNVSLSYTLSKNSVQKLGFKSIRLIAEAQNVFTITNYKGFDPETYSSTTLPNLRTITVGINCTL